MGLLEPVTDEERAALKRRRRSSRVSAPILREFLTSDLDLARVKTERDPKSLAMTLRQYIRAHNLPVIVHVTNNAVYLERKKAQEAVELTEDVVDAH